MEFINLFWIIVVVVFLYAVLILALRDLNLCILLYTAKQYIFKACFNILMVASQFSWFATLIACSCIEDIFMVWEGFMDEFIIKLLILGIVNLWFIGILKSRLKNLGGTHSSNLYLSSKEIKRRYAINTAIIGALWYILSFYIFFYCLESKYIDISEVIKAEYPSTICYFNLLWYVALILFFIPLCYSFYIVALTRYGDESWQFFIILALGFLTVSLFVCLFHWITTFTIYLVVHKKWIKLANTLIKIIIRKIRYLNS